MNRAKKEELKRYHEARKGLTPEEIAAVDAREAAEKAFDRDAQRMHRRLFPEEYDFYGDEIVDVKLRAQGINPMSAEYIARTDARRAALGFAGYMAKNDSRPDNTMGWVRQMMLDGRRDELERLCQRFEDTKVET
ncbi:hypothetical protein GOC57_29755 [Sinorhizobium meliloti]|nr:hypothetical protein [Sinorhizobium meliloti]MDW9564936.1 hypothetical protein [Sinorhizobium meliloti]MDW9652461.1 hypothetical protein [Sinorhizobium meliloti]MDW9862870.1 hypothetical protein [Sinorhizobium meliloti]MDW9968003.1 hypothetical protein [Sinorhizobium meliloti]